MNQRLAAVAVAAWLAAGAGPADGEQPAAPSLDAFGDAIQHWRSGHGADYPRHAPEQVAQIADNILLYQRQDGGWVQNQDPARILDAAERAKFAEESAESGGSFDNRNIYTQIEYLAAAHALTGDARYREASLRGLEFTLAHQHPHCGGWPHSVPATQRYHSHITIADDVTAGVLATLRRAASADHGFGFIDAPLRERIQQAIARGDACLLQLQVRQGETLAGWAGQYDGATLQPAQGRAFELPAIVADESVGVVRYLMSIPDPSPEIVAAIEGAVDWMRKVELKGWRLETFEAEPEQYRYHASRQDRRLVADHTAGQLWARFYDLQDNSVVLATRDGKRVANYSDIPRERRTGYHWYGSWPQSLLTKDYPRWNAARAPAR